MSNEVINSELRSINSILNYQSKYIDQNKYCDTLAVYIAYFGNIYKDGQPLFRYGIVTNVQDELITLENKFNFVKLLTIAPIEESSLLVFKFKDYLSDYPAAKTDLGESFFTTNKNIPATSILLKFNNLAIQCLAATYHKLIPTEDDIILENKRLDNEKIRLENQKLKLQLELKKLALNITKMQLIQPVAPPVEK